MAFEIERYTGNDESAPDSLTPDTPQEDIVIGRREMVGWVTYAEIEVTQIGGKEVAVQRPTGEVKVSYRTVLGMPGEGWEEEWHRDRETGERHFAREKLVAWATNEAHDADEIARSPALSRLVQDLSDRGYTTRFYNTPDTPPDSL